MTKLFELLKQKKANQTSQSEAEKQLKDIVAEVEKLKKQMQDKLREIQGSFGFTSHTTMI